METIEEEFTQEEIRKMKIKCDKQKAWCKKYHMSELGKLRRREAQHRYYMKKKAEKLISN
tara:strand:- start:1495 stop:1674 length:180 start_codon:yes stop_codon:yes gene_type:complete